MCDLLLVLRFEGLVPGPEFQTWCALGARVFAATPERGSRRPADTAQFQAYALLCQGRAEQAWEAYHDRIEPQWMLCVHRRCQARILAEQAEVQRQLGHYDEAFALLEQTQAIQVEQNYWGDLADLALTNRAKLLACRGQLEDAEQCLGKALRMQRDAAHVVGEVRALLLTARLSRRHVPPRTVNTTVRTRIEQIVADRPALANCRRMRQILAHWDLWASGESLPGETLPGETLPGETLPGETLPGETLPGVADWFCGV